MNRIEELRAIYSDDRRDPIERQRAFNEYDSLRFQELRGIAAATSLINGLSLPETVPTMTSIRIKRANSLAELEGD